MPIKEPFDYDLTPREVDAGVEWLMLTLRNVIDEELRNLSVNLNSTDTYQINVQGTGSFVPVIHPKEAQQLPFQVTAKGTTQLYVSVDGWRDEEEFHWESPGISITVGLDVAELASFFALTEPYPTLGTSVTLEATVRGLSFNEGLGLEFWAETPRQEFISIDKMPTDPVPEGETATYETEFTPDEPGIYTLHAYLYAGTRRIGHAVEHLSVTR